MHELNKWVKNCHIIIQLGPSKDFVKSWWEKDYTLEMLINWIWNSAVKITFSCGEKETKQDEQTTTTSRKYLVIAIVVHVSWKGKSWCEQEFSF